MRERGDPSDEVVAVARGARGMVRGPPGVLPSVYASLRFVPRLPPRVRVQVACGTWVSLLRSGVGTKSRACMWENECAWSDPILKSCSHTGQRASGSRTNHTDIRMNMLFTHHIYNASTPKRVPEWRESRLEEQVRPGKPRRHGRPICAPRSIFMLGMNACAANARRTPMCVHAQCGEEVRRRWKVHRT